MILPGLNRLSGSKDCLDLAHHAVAVRRRPAACRYSVRAMPTPCSPASEPLNCAHQRRHFIGDLPEFFQVLRVVQIQHRAHVQQARRRRGRRNDASTPTRAIKSSKRARHRPADRRGRTAASSMSTAGLASPLQLVSSESPALRMAQTRFMFGARLQHQAAQAQLALLPFARAVLARRRKIPRSKWRRTVARPDPAGRARP